MQFVFSLLFDFSHLRSAVPLCTDCKFNFASGSTQEGKRERDEVSWNINYGS